ncbi:hypothetical protein GTY54_07305 [Streptomyces sp. SID625]|nr:hypothetical protein [Streptomyces sp. SID625]
MNPYWTIVERRAADHSLAHARPDAPLPAGQSLYDRGEVEAARATRPGRGARTDLRTNPSP